MPVLATTIALWTDTEALVVVEQPVVSLGKMPVMLVAPRLPILHEAGPSVDVVHSPVQVEP
jgi:hypothetical protein